MAYDLLIFDFDGTLVDTRVDITNAINDMLERFGRARKGVDEVTSYVGDGIRKIVERSIDGSGITPDDAVLVFREAYARRLLEHTRPYPGVVAALKGMGDRLKAVLTNKAYEYTTSICDGLGLAEYFTVILGGDSVKNRKPATEGVDRILALTGVPKSKAVMIGDSANDVLTAKNAGIASVYVTWGFSAPDKVRDLGPDYTIHDPRQLAAVC